MPEQLRTIDELLNKREIKRAEVLIAKALRGELVPKAWAQMMVQRARARLLSARPEDALDDLFAARAASPQLADQPDWLELLGDCYFARFELASVGFADRHDTALAIDTYTQILNRFPAYENLGWIYYQMGRVLLTDNKVEEAADCFHKGLLSPSHLSALTAYCYERLAFVSFYESRDLNKALALISKAIDTYPPAEDRRWLVQVHILRSRVLRDMHRYEQALKAAETALSVAANSGSETKLGLAEALLTTGELLADIEGRERDVITNLQHFLQISKKPLGVDVTWSRVHEMLGDAYFKTGQYGAAASGYQAVLQFNPYHPWEVSLYFRIARSYYQQGDYERAVQSINRMLDAAKAEGQTVSDYRVYDVLGNAQFALGKYDEALEAYRTALHVAPPNADNLDTIRAYHDFAKELSRPL
jgi:tetratricopeptide (TPR) repeat protein